MNGLIVSPTSVPLKSESLSELPKSVSYPCYDRNDLTPGIIHIGVGNFHRAHQAWYLHRLMQVGEARDWAIIGAGVRPFDEQQRVKLLGQDFLTTLIELDPSGTSAEVIGSMIDYIPVQVGNHSLIERMGQDNIRIVSLTVTEGGYYIDPATKGFDLSHPDILHDIANPENPITAHGAIVAALRQRRDKGMGPFTCLSCDNLQGNGAILRQTVLSLARQNDPKLADWIDLNCSFPNSMVDCIVPATGPRELKLVQSLGIDDAAPVAHESYRQWVIEDDFCAGRPNWDKFGATFSNDVHFYEAMKIRILNACHSVIAETGQVLGVQTISDCMEHPIISSFIKRLAIEEIAPTVNAVPEYTPLKYVQLVLDRFSNQKIIDTTQRVATDGSSKHPGFLLPVIQEQLAANRSVQGLALAEAIWARMCERKREDGSELEARDPHWAELRTVALSAKTNPIHWLTQKQYYGDLANNVYFTETFSRWLTMIWGIGLERTIESYLKS